MLVDVWWFPATNNPLEPCYAYWSTNNEPKAPVRFFGISTVGPTMFNYHDYQPNEIPPGLTSIYIHLEINIICSLDISLKLPTDRDCNKECILSTFTNKLKRAVHIAPVSDWPDTWPTCE